MIMDDGACCTMHVEARRMMRDGWWMVVTVVDVDADDGG